MVVGPIGPRAFGCHYLGRFVDDRRQRGRTVHGVDIGVGGSICAIAMV